MAVKTKHEFVDDNPYLVYSGDIDVSYNAESGGGGGGGGGGTGDNGVFVVHITGANISEWNSAGSTNFNVLESVDDIAEAFLSGKKVIAITNPMSIGNAEMTAQLDLCSVNAVTINNTNAYQLNFEAGFYTVTALGVTGNVCTIVIEPNESGNYVFTGYGAPISISGS